MPLYSHSYIAIFWVLRSICSHSGSLPQKGFSFEKQIFAIENIVENNEDHCTQWCANTSIQTLLE